MPAVEIHLIEQAKTGNVVALNRLVQSWHPRIYNFAWKYFSKHGDQGVIHDLAMEVAQKTFITMYEKLDRLQENQRFKSWLYRIAVNYCHEEERKRKRGVLSFFSLGEEKERELKNSHHSQMPDPQSSTQTENLSFWIKEAMNQLPPEQRIAILMKEYEGFKFREIAETLGISENTVKSRVYYGLNSLKKILNSWDISKENMLYE